MSPNQVSEEAPFVNKSVLIVTPRFYPLIGGQEIQAERLANLLCSAGARVTMMTEGVNISQPKLLKNFDFDITYLKNNKKFPFSRLWMFFRSLSYYGANAQKFDLIVVRTFSVHSLALGLNTRIRKSLYKSIVLTDSATEVPAVSQSLFSALYRLMLNGNDYINAISPEVEFQLKDLKIRPDKIKRIPNILQELPIPDHVTIEKPCKRFLYVGNIAREKGVFDLLEGFMNVKSGSHDISLDFYGIGNDKLELSRLICDLNMLESVKLHDVIPNEEVARLFGSFDCLIYPSHSEGFGLVPFEAAPFPIAIIATNVGVLEKYLKERCEFVAVNDPTSLSFAIKDACVKSLKPYELSNLNWKSSFSPEKILSEFADVLLK